MTLAHKIFASLRHNPLLRFLLSAIGLYILWYAVYEIWLHPQGTVDRLVINNSIFITVKILALLGYPTFTGASEVYHTIGIQGSQPLWIGNPCNGISLFALFSGFIIAYPGPVIRKLWYIPAGVLTLHVLNTLRIASLCIIEYHRPDLLQFNHTYTFTLLVYFFVFALWILWTNKLAVVVKK